MNQAKKIAVTGIPGTGTTDFCRQYDMVDVELLRVNSYNLGEILLNLAQEAPRKPSVSAGNLLNLQPELLVSLQDRAFNSVLTNIANDQESYDRLMIDLHTQFFWNDVLTNAYDWRHLVQLDANLFLTLIEKPSIIKERQLSTPQGLFQQHDLRDLLFWQNVEVNVTQGWASNFGKPHYVLPGQQDPIIIESLLKSAFLIYFQMPMTDASSEADAMVTDFKNRLLNLGRMFNGFPTPVIDPRLIDIESGEGVSAREERAIRLQTVHRDLNWYIAEASDLVAFYPPGTTLSKGVSDETARGFETGKNCFVIYPYEKSSPFMDICTKVFMTPDEFFDFYADYLPQRIKELSRKL